MDIKEPIPEPVDETTYTKVPYEFYETLEDKILALMSGETLFIRNFEVASQRDVLVRMVDKKYRVSQISFDMSPSDNDPRHWTTYNVGINDLSLFTVLKYTEGIGTRSHTYKIDDVVYYVKDTGGKGSAFIEEVWESTIHPRDYAYKITGREGLIKESDLITPPRF